ncbi:MAG: DNA-3-methyladenine glycosylase family protein [Egibacteraceae bacterium]
MTTGLAPSQTTLLAADRWRVRVDVGRVPVTDSARRGAVAVAVQRGVARRAEAGTAGPLILQARAEPDGVALEVWGPSDTAAEEAAGALEAAVAWVGLRDDLDGFAQVANADRVTRRLLRDVGEVRLSRLPRVGEALGRAVLGQLVQSVEARRSTAQVAALAGTPAPGGLWAWPTARQIGSAPAWALRRCGVSARGTRALHEGAIADRRLAESAAARDWARLDRQLRALPGVGVWTSAETRLALGDADAVSVGDYHLPSLVGSVLGEPGGRRADYDDEGMLAPFAPHRGRVVQLIGRAAAQGLVSGPARRGPRAALSAHRYW